MTEQKSSKHLISVIIPVFNGERTVERVVRSVLANRTDEIGIETIVVDDGSTDATPEILDRLARETDIRLIRTENRGAAAARNAGLRTAKGAFIGFVDSDDRIQPDMYRKLLLALSEHDADLAGCGVIHETEYGAIPEKGDGGTAVFEGETIYRAILGSQGMRGYLWNKLFKRELIHTPLDESLLQCEDLLFCAQNLESVRRAVYLSEPLYRYTRKADGEELSLKRGLSLAGAQEKLLALYREKAPGSAYIPERNLLKTFLYLRAKAKQEHERDEAVLSRIRSGIKTHFCRVMREKDVSVKTKGNIVFTYLFPRASLRIKRRILKKRHQNGIWES